MDKYQTAFFGGLIPAAIFAYPIYRALLALKARQTVSQHVKEHAHKQGTPTMGGLMILAGLIPALVLYVIPFYMSPVPPRKLEGVLALVVGYALIGFVDDFLVPRLMEGKRGLGWTQKLVLQIGVAAGAASMLGPVSGVAHAFAVVSILFFANAFNFTDGLDWLSSTVLIGLAGGIAALAYWQQASMVSYLMLLVMGATLPFMVFNRPPAKIFMGDVGSMPIGALLGICVAGLAWPGSALHVGIHDQGSLALGISGVYGTLGEGVTSFDPRPIGIWIALIVMSFVMFAELLPPPLQIASVKIRKKRLFPMTPIHHAFQKAGWPETKIVAMFFGVQLACTILGLSIGEKVPTATPEETVARVQ